MAAGAYEISTIAVQLKGVNTVTGPTLTGSQLSSCSNALGVLLHTKKPSVWSKSSNQFGVESIDQGLIVSGYIFDWHLPYSCCNWLLLARELKQKSYIKTAS